MSIMNPRIMDLSQPPLKHQSVQIKKVGLTDKHNQPLQSVLNEKFIFGLIANKCKNIIQVFSSWSKEHDHKHI